MFLTFAYLTFCSIFIGILFGLLCAYVLKSMNFETHPVREIFLILLFAYVSYIASEMLGFSGIMTLFCCGFTMA
jgi:NhaP-type Na+/H+ or K+/H+ antiporter